MTNFYSLNGKMTPRMPRFQPTSESNLVNFPRKRSNIRTDGFYEIIYVDEQKKGEIPLERN